ARDGRRVAARAHRRRQALLRERRGMEAARELAQLLERQVELARGAGENRLHRIRILLELRACESERQRQRHEPLLRAVVEVSLEPAPLLVSRLDEARAGRLQILTRLCARDG